jgi:hypothetical protein
MMEAVKVVVALREAAVLEPLAAVVALYESTTITVLETATLAALCEPRSTHSRPSKATAAAVAACHCARMATTAPTTATMAAATATATVPAAAAATTTDKRDDAIMTCAQGDFFSAPKEKNDGEGLETP